MSFNNELKASLSVSSVPEEYMNDVHRARNIALSKYIISESDFSFKTFLTLRTNLSLLVN